MRAAVWAAGELAASVWAVGAGVLAPGALVVRAADLGRTRLERLVIAIAIGRTLLALAALATASLGVPHALPVLAALAAGGWALLATRDWRRGVPPRAPSRTTLVDAALLAAASVFLVAGVAARSGLAAPAGALLFFGRHVASDPLVYAAMATQLELSGLPVENPLVAGLPNLGHHLFFGSLAGLRAVAGLDPLDVAFRVRPLLDVGALALTALAVGRALGAGRTGARIGALLVILGGGLSQPLFAAARALGTPFNELEIWGFGTSFLLGFNPLAPALQTAFAAALLLATRGGDDVRRGAAAGLLCTAVYELKLFLWPPLLGAVVLCALLRRPAGRARRLRVCAGVALATGLPLLVQTLALSAELAGQAEVGVQPCPGCLPRFALGSLVGDPARLVATFDAFTWGDLARPAMLAWTLGASLGYLLVMLGARLLAGPPLLRLIRARGPAPSVLLGHLLGVAALLGIPLSCLVSTPPHHANAGQFALAASLLLWPAAGLLLGRWLGGGRTLLAVGVLALAFASSPVWIVERGYRAPLQLRVEPGERELMDALADASRPGDRVLEPSLLLQPAIPSPVAWLAGRGTYLSTQGMALYLDAAERTLREQVIATAYASDDRQRALGAIRASGARFVYAPAALPLRFLPGDALETVASSPAGAVYRVTAPGASGRSPRTRTGN